MCKKSILFALLLFSTHQIFVAEYFLLCVRDQKYLEVEKNLQDRVTHFFGWDKTPLKVAAEKGDNKMIELLLNYGEKIDGSSVCHGTALTVAVEHNHLSTVDLLIKRGADVNQGDNHTPLCHAVISGHDKIVRKLIRHRADIHARDAQNLNVLYWAVLSDHIKAAEALIQAGAHVNEFIGPRYLKTVLHVAARNRSGRNSSVEDMAKMLVQHGANPLLVNEFGKRPSQIADDQKIKEFLERAEIWYKGKMNYKVAVCVDNIRQRHPHFEARLEDEILKYLI